MMLVMILLSSGPHLLIGELALVWQDAVRVGTTVVSLLVHSLALAPLREHGSPQRAAHNQGHAVTTRHALAHHTHKSLGLCRGGADDDAGHAQPFTSAAAMERIGDRVCVLVTIIYTPTNIIT